jgi:primosomal protein N' (replication factor Y)
MSKIAVVVLPIPLNKPFHYSIPESLQSAVSKGTRVLVPFGNRKISGYVADIIETTYIANIKEVYSVIDDAPAVDKNLFELAKWLSTKYVCSLGEALSAVVPSVLKPPKRIFNNKPEHRFGINKSIRPTLTQTQQTITDAITHELKNHKYEAFLLRGVTGSGKTEIYLCAIEEALALGKSAIFLLPEISLTPQFISIIKSRFGDNIGVWHSKLSVGEKYRTWLSAKKGEIKIMVGARSSVFTPFEKLGIIVIDEEHEQSYKQDKKPTYHVREVALERAKLSNAVVIMGSATPSLESYWRAQNGEFRLFELHERIDNKQLPPITIVDLNCLSAKHKIISEPFKNALIKTLARREQAVIFLNRRGFSPWLMCQACQKVWQCHNCSVSLVYHKDSQELVCHYCGHRQPIPDKCPNCSSDHLSIFGIGTQKVEEELKKNFPQARIARLDRDTASKKDAYKNIYENFKNEDCDILIGTQIVAKGFDFPRVTFVGVVDADTCLYLPDFRSAERTFALMTQVSGRAGRSSLGGEVVIQTKHPQHYALVAAKQHDYKSFYEQEINFRKELNYPPFCGLVNILLRGKKAENVSKATDTITQELLKWKKENNAAIEVLGSTPAAIEKIKGMFRWQILLKGKADILINALMQMKNCSLPSGVIITLDIDPQDVL